MKGNFFDSSGEGVLKKKKREGLEALKQPTVN